MPVAEWNRAIAAINSGACPNLASAQAKASSFKIGSDSSPSPSTQQTDSARGSTVIAGRNLIAATALRQAQDERGDGNLSIHGSSVQASQSAALLADNQINLLAAQNTSSQSASESSSGSLGISYSNTQVEA